MTDDEKLYIPDVAARLGVTESTIRSYRSKSRGQMPAADGMDRGGIPWWYTSTIEKSRPGRKVRRDG